MSTLNLAKIIKYLWIATLAGVMLVIALFLLVSITKMPDTAELEKPKYEQSTIVYAEGLEELGRKFNKNREYAEYDELSKNVVQALLATEDHRFYKHSGIDFYGTARAAFYLGRKGGASTITQQLAKLFFTPVRGNALKRIWQKMKEWVIAIEFEKRYTKEEIIAMYLNKFEFLHQSFGIGAASRTYFGKHHSKLKVEEAAVLVGMLKNPRFYNPTIYRDNATSRRNVVLKQMYRNDFLEKSVYDSLRVLEIDISSFKKEVHHDGPAPYFVVEVSKEVSKILENEKYQKPGGGKYNIYEDGLRVYTTINLQMQEHAEAAMKRHMRTLQKRYFHVWRNIDPWSYEASNAQERLRRATLKGKIYDSSRYRTMREAYLSGTIQKIAKEIEDVRLWDADIRRMLEEENNPGHLGKMLKKNQISSGQREVYTQILQSEHWSTLKKDWNALHKSTQDAFKKKVKMKVFSYDGAGEKDTIMSPLDSIKYHAMHMQFGSMSIEPNTGYVKTWVGGIGHKYFQYDHIRSNRQVGSTFKPFIYTTAILQGRSPCWKIRDQQYIIKKGDPDFGLMEDWDPKNSKDFTNVEYTLKEGLRQSLNSFSVKLMKEIGSVRAVIDMAHNLGIPEDKYLPNAPSICLGAAELSVMDMTTAYATIANNGVYTEPVFIKKIEDKDGRVIYNASTKQRTALAQNFNYAMIDMLKYAASVVSYQLESDFGGKTGTTNDHVDGWFVGITPDLVTGTWVGGEHPWFRFLSIGDGAGSKMARPFYLDFMKRVESDPSKLVDVTKRFELPEGQMDIELDCEKYERLYQQNIQESKTDDDEFEEESEEE